jgi:hypothetical protein
MRIKADIADADLERTLAGSFQAAYSSGEMQNIR